MTDDQINDEIMRQLGWEFRCGGWRRGEDEFVNASDAPNFAGSLDAMHEAEERLSLSESCDFTMVLSVFCGADLGEGDISDIFCVARATARQRAEAFLRVKGAWVE